MQKFSDFLKEKKSDQNLHEIAPILAPITSAIGSTAARAAASTGLRTLATRAIPPLMSTLSGLWKGTKAVGGFAKEFGKGLGYGAAIDTGSRLLGLGGDDDSRSEDMEKAQEELSRVIAETEKALKENLAAEYKKFTSDLSKAMTKMTNDFKMRLEKMIEGIAK